MTISFPASLDTAATLTTAVNNLYTTVASTYLTPAATMDLTDASGFPSAGGIAYADGYRFTYTGKAGNQLTGVAGLGFNISNGLTVEMMADAQQINDVRDAVLAVEAKVGATGSAVTSSHEYRLVDIETNYSTKVYVDGLVVGLLDDRGNHDASGNVFPSSGGSGTAGAIKKGDVWYISNGGTLGSNEVSIGDTIRALADTPGQTAGNWDIMRGHLSVSGETHAATSKATPVDSDEIPLIDSAASYVLKKLTWANLKATLKTWLESLSITMTGLSVSSINGGQLAGIRNKIIGGDFATNPWQRGTTFTGLSSGLFSADRFKCNNGTDAVFDFLKTADAPTVAQAGTYTTHCLHVDVTTADAAIGAAQVAGVRQDIEGLNVVSFGFGQSGTRDVTLSFWHKHTKTGTYCVAIRNSAIDRSYIAEYTQAVTDTWEKVTITIPVDTSGTWLYDSGIGVKIDFVIAAGTNYHTAANTWTAGNYQATSNQVNGVDSTSNNFKLALIQLEPGSVATPFETLPVGQVLQLCQRYYYRLTPAATGETLGLGWCTSTTRFLSSLEFPIVMRTAPTALEQSGTATDYSVGYLNVSAACSAVPAFSSANTRWATIILDVAAGLTAGDGGRGRSANGSAGYLGWSAEL